MSKAKDIRCFLINECSTYSQKVWQILGVFYTLFYKEKSHKKTIIINLERFTGDM